MSDDIQTIENVSLPAASEAGPHTTVVGIGASSGGLSALKQFFEPFTADSGLAFVVVVHLSPEHKSLFADLLQRSVRFPVQQVTETVLLEKNNVYIIPPNANLSAIDTHLRLSKLEENRRERAPINHFFRTLATTHDGHAIGVILTGTGSDGTLGLREIKAKGGITLVQDPNEAEYDGMPQSAIAAGLADRVLSIADIRDAVLRFSVIEPRITITKSGDEPGQREQALLAKALAVLKTRTERDFSSYKPSTVLRRIARRMHLNYMEDAERYTEKLREEPEEARALADDLLMTVTSFFRDADLFQKLEREIVPKLFDGRGPGDGLRVWTVGCATGEEAYSIAMLLLEEAARRSEPPKIQIFASDLHKRSLDGAREGLYSHDIEADVSPERLKRFFQLENGCYRIGKDIRDTVVFAPHNLLGDPPFTRLELITCRNLLIDLDGAAQRDVISLFHYALCRDGYLLLDSTEPANTSELFLAEDKKLCIYKKRNVPVRETHLPVFPFKFPQATGRSVPGSDGAQPAISYQSLHQKLVEQNAPQSVLVGPDNKVAFLSRQAGKYFVHPKGEVTSNVFRLVRDELREELQALLPAARETREPADSAAIRVRFNGHTASVVMQVRPAQDSKQDGFTLVVFDERSSLQADPGAASENPPFTGTPEDERLKYEHRATQNTELRWQLTAARQRLQTTVQEYETSHQEMEASNEEMQSANEELRSILEQLKTSQEELQSVNEELQMVSQENRCKVEELSLLSDDLQNLLTATNIATLFLDGDLRIMRFTPRLAELFNVRISDRGRPLSDLTHRLGYKELREDAQAVLARCVAVERETRDDAGRWYLIRILPYRRTDDRIEGVVITFIEITARKSAEVALRESEERQALLLHLSDELRPLLDPEAVQNKASQLLGMRLSADRVFYAEVDRGELASVATDYHSQEVGPVTGRHRLDDFGSLLAQTLAAGRTLISSNVALLDLSAAQHAAYRELDVAALVKVPLIKEGRLIAYLGVHQKKPREWARHEITLIEAVAERTWAALERTYAERTLRRSEERLRLALDASHMGTFLYHIQEDRGEPDSRMLTLFGLPEDGKLNMRETIGTLVHPDDQARYSAAVARAVDPSGSGSLREDIRVVHPDGRVCWVEVIAQVVFDSDPRRPSVMWGMAADITERKRTEAALRESEERQSALLQLSDVLRPLASPAVIAQTACQLLAEHLDASGAQYISIEGKPGNETGEVLGEHVRIGEPMQRRFSLSEFGEDALAVLRAGQTLVLTDIDRDPRVSQSQRRAFRALNSAAAVSVPLLKEGRLFSLLTVHHISSCQWTASQITLMEEVAERSWAAIERARAEAALRQSEERVRLFVKNVREYALVQTDSQGTTTHWNPGAQRLFGYPPERMLGRSFAALLMVEDREQVLSRELAVVTQGHRNEDSRWFVRQDGSRFWGHWISEPILDENGDFRGVAKIISDETERQRASDAVQHSLLEKEHLLKEVHHRVKNNLQVITSLLSMQASKIQDERVLALFEETRNRVLAISSIHEQLYSAESFARISLSEYARRLAQDLVSFYGLEQQVNLEITGDPGITLELERAVPYGMLLNELVSNSCKHAFLPPKPGVLKIEIRAENESNEIILVVADNGAGLPPGTDYRIASSLGLKLVRGLVRQLGGTMEIESKQGAAVNVRFPAVDDGI